MAEKSRLPEELTFEYKISPVYTAYAVSGVFGGLNSQGQIIMNFFNERHAIPKMQTYSVLPDGSLGTEPISEEKKKNVIRDVMFAISISPPTARAFAKWLTDNANLVDNIMSEKEKETDGETEAEVH